MSQHLLILHDASDASRSGREKLAQKLADYLGLSSHAIEAMFTDLPVILRQGLSLEVAQQQKRKLEELGAIVEILAEDPKGSNEDLQTITKEHLQKTFHDAGLGFQLNNILSSKNTQILKQPLKESSSAYLNVSSSNPSPVIDCYHQSESSLFIDLQPASAQGAQTEPLQFSKSDDLDNLNIEVEDLTALLQQELLLESLPSKKRNEQTPMTPSKEASFQFEETQLLAPIQSTGKNQKSPEPTLPPTTFDFEPEPEAQRISSQASPAASGNTPTKIEKPIFATPLGTEPLDMQLIANTSQQTGDLSTKQETAHDTSPQQESSLATDPKEAPSPEETENILRRAYSPTEQSWVDPATPMDQRNKRNLADGTTGFGRRRLTSLAIGAFALALIALIAVQNPFTPFHKENPSPPVIKVGELLKQQNTILGDQNITSDGNKTLPGTQLLWSGQTTDQSYTGITQILTDSTAVTQGLLVVTSIAPPKLSIEDVGRGMKPKPWLRKLVSEKLLPLPSPIAGSDSQTSSHPSTFQLEGTGKAYVQESSGTHRMVVKVMLVGIWDQPQKKIQGRWKVTSESPGNIQKGNNVIERAIGRDLRIAISGPFEIALQENPTVKEPIPDDSIIPK